MFTIDTIEAIINTPEYDVIIVVAPSVIDRAVYVSGMMTALSCYEWSIAWC